MRIPKQIHDQLIAGDMPNPSAFSIYYILCDMALDTDHWLTLTLEEIGTIARISSNTTIQTGLRELQKAGLIEKKKISHRKRAYRVIG